MKRFATVLAVVAAACLAFGVAMAGAPDKPIVIKAIQKSKPPVTFEHAKHAKLDCKKCHHKNDAGKEQGCSACHGAAADGKKLELKEAFHKACKGCHTEAKKGPTKCDECHKK